MVKKQKVGFAFILLGMIFAASTDAKDTILWWIGSIVRTIGIIIVAIDSSRRSKITYDEWRRKSK